MAVASTFTLYDRLAGGKLERLLRQMRADGHSYERIAELLRAEHDIPVTTSTVARWCRALGLPARVVRRAS